jgi:(4-(4-[2-(gamma-L-glutamylamino)ethyl]phenoxymethyl)furan-2-yl)methanamine synthase
MPSPDVFGWDIGGAHVKVCHTHQGQVLDIMQWACPLWQGLDQLDQVLDQALARWPRLRQAGDTAHAVTMTGEMVDLFAHREDGVRRITTRLAERLDPAATCIFAGDAGWCDAASVGAHWASIASANWLATARHVARETAGQRAGPGSRQTARAAANGSTVSSAGVLVDIGSTTTDLIAFRDGDVLTRARSDADRLASGELVYHGVVRTPLCALAPRIRWRGRSLNVMNEFFATTADVYRLTGELDPTHDLHPSADGGAKDLPATRQRLARMIGLDARDAHAADWLDLAHAWRDAQVQDIAGQLQRVLAMHGMPSGTRLVSAGCGDFLLPELARHAGLYHGLAYGAQVARLAPDRPALQAWAQVCAPCIAVASLLYEHPVETA